MSESTQEYVVLDGLTWRTLIDMDVMRRIFPQRVDGELMRWLEILYSAEVRFGGDIAELEQVDWNELVMRRGLADIVVIALRAQIRRNDNEARAPNTLNSE